MFIYLYKDIHIFIHLKHVYTYIDINNYIEIFKYLSLGFKDDQRRPWADRDQGDKRKGAGYKGSAPRTNVAYPTDGRGRGRGRGGRGGRDGGGRGWNQEGGGRGNQRSEQPRQASFQSTGAPKRAGWSTTA